MAKERIITEFDLSIDPAFKPDVQICVRLRYENGFLCSIDGLREVAENGRYILFTLPVPLLLEKMPVVKADHKGTFIFKLLEADKASDKIAIFCEEFKEALEFKYKVDPKQARQWKTKYKHVPADREVLRFYMTCTDYPCNGPKDIADYCRNYQAVLQLMKVKDSKFPNRFDAKLYRELSLKNPTEYQAYKKHLRDLGFVKSTSTGAGEVWKKVKSDERATSKGNA